MSNVDIGEMFYNYILDPAIQGYCGVDLSPYCEGTSTWEVWTRCVMGIRSSPHGCTLMEMISDEMAQGKSADPSNPFHFDEIRMNLPGSSSYNPSHPWVSKIVRSTGRIAADIKTYVDDKRVTGASKSQCEAATRRAASFLTYLGEQDACQKRVEASRRAGAWAGSVCHTDGGSVTVLVTANKWAKAQGYVQELLDIATTTNVFDHKELERIRGFLIHIIRSYPAFTPYLKGIHLTLDSWRPGRRWDGWRDPGELLPDDIDGNLGPPPTQVIGVPRLLQDLQALAALFEPEAPPRRQVRTKEVAVVLYGFGDASRTGFGSSFITPSGARVRHGLWGRDLSHRSSNFRELQNLVDALDYELEDTFPILRTAVDEVSALVNGEQLFGLEIFLFTDNIVAECAFYRGTSANPLLFDLILRLKQLELSHSLQLHVIHIAGSRMTAQGTDGLSRGVSWESNHLLTGVPLHLSAFERDALLLPWCHTWIPAGLTPYVLTLIDWYTLGHGILGDSTNCDGIWTPHLVPATTLLVWHPAPAAAEAALEELCLSRHKRPSIRHLFLCPRLFTHTWRKRLFKFADFIFNLSPGFIPNVWTLDQFEPLVVAVFLPIRTGPPWREMGSPWLLDLHSRLRRAFATRNRDLHVLLTELWSPP
jgi:hypothetical protein